MLDESRAALVNACVGSGKTTVLVAKVLHLCLDCGVPLEDMVVLTFTNKAAREIRERMNAAAGAVEEKMPWFGTFHGVALRLLASVLPVETLGYGPGFSVLDDDAKTELAERVIAERGFRIVYKNKLLKRLAACRSGKPIFGAMKRQDDIAALSLAVDEEKVKRNLMDFDDLIENAARLLPRSDFRPAWVIVDEFQDCDDRQLGLLRALAFENTRLFCVGDQNQVIYTWRGGGLSVIGEYRRSFTPKEFSLPTNYRSSATILRAASSLLDGGALAGVRAHGGRVTVRRHYNPFLEADYLCDKIAELHSGGLCYRDVAVFYRLQRQSAVLADTFSRRGIPFEISAKRSLKDLPVLRWLIRVLAAAVDPADGTALKAALAGPGSGAKMPENLAGRIGGFMGFAAGGPSPEKIYSYFDIDALLGPTTADYGENRRLVLSALGALCQTASCGDIAAGVRAFVNGAVLSGADFPAEGKGAENDGVRLMTLHACKGLEFRCVFIVGVNRGLIPLVSKGCDPDEELRLFYVGVTRVRDRLELSYYSNPDDARVVPGPSRFISMIPRGLLDYGGERGGGADLQTLRREILKNRERAAASPFAPGPPEAPKTPGAAEPPKAPAAPPDRARRAAHPRYGEGTVVAEDEATVTVAFEHYGNKEFSKDFCPLTFL